MITTYELSNSSDIRTLSVRSAHLRAMNDNGTLRIAGTAVVFGKRSRLLHDTKVTTRPFYEYIESGALDGVDLSNVFLLYGHDYHETLARVDSGTLKLSVDKNGVEFTAELPDTTLARDTYENIRSGNIKGCSFGFNVAPGGDALTPNPDGTVDHLVYHIQDFNEITLTPIPAYTQTSVELQRELRNLETKKEDKKTMNSSATSSASATSTASSAASSVATSSTSAQVVASVVASAVEPLTDAISNINTSLASVASVVNQRECDTGDHKSKREDDDNQDVDTMDGSVDDVDDNNDDEEDEKREIKRESAGDNKKAQGSAQNSAQDNKTKEDNKDMMKIKTNEGNDSKREVVRDFGHYLLTREMTPTLQRDAQAQGVGLPTGGVLIPQTILTAQHEEHQYPRLEDYVNHVPVSTTTGKQPYFEENTAVLQTKEEFNHASNVALSAIKEIIWNLKTYAGTLSISRELLMDAEHGSSENWITEAQNQMRTMQDNTNDQLISAALQNGVKVNNATNAVDDMKTILNVTLKPKDSQQSQIVLTASAYNALDQLKDGYGRPLLQPDPTSATSNLLFGKPVIVVDDTLFGKSGDAIAVIAPLKKAIYDFQMGQVSGQFIDNFDIFDTRLGVFIRKDVETARPDLINILKLTPKSLAASDPSHA